jgi:hypothetical protein
MNWAERLAIGLLGVILVYLAWFIDPEEIEQTTEGLDKLGNRLKVAEYTAISWQTRFLQGISAKFVSAVTKLFGESIFSSQSIGCSAMACGIPLALTFVIYNPVEWWVKALYALTFCYLAADATSLEKTHPYYAQIPGAAYGILILIASPSIYKWWKWNRGLEFGGMGIFPYVKEFLVYVALPLAAPFAVGVLFVMFLAGINRGIARRSSKSDNSWVFLSLLPINALVAGCFLVLGKFISAAYSYTLAHSEGMDYSQLYIVLYLLSYFVTLSLLPALGALSIAVLACGPFLHRLLWPLIRRPIQAAAFHKLLEQHKLLFTVGAYCLYLAWPENPVVRFVHDVLAKGE